MEVEEAEAEAEAQQGEIREKEILGGSEATDILVQSLLHFNAAILVRLPGRGHQGVKGNTAQGRGQNPESDIGGDVLNPYLLPLPNVARDIVEDEKKKRGGAVVVGIKRTRRKIRRCVADYNNEN